MNYADFKAYLLRALWRTGDGDFEADLDVLIRKAESRINRDLREITATKSVDIEITTNTFDLPTDYVEATAVVIRDSGTYLSPTTVQRFMALDDQDATGNLFVIVGRQMRVLQNPSATEPMTVQLTYYYRAPAFAATVGDNQFYEDAPDFYEAAVRVQCYDYLREFELSAEYNGVYASLLESMEKDSTRREFPAGAIDCPLPGIVA
jgi:hypothetical protein